MKTKSSKEAWELKREPYKWHLLPPFTIKFDRCQWWIGKTDKTIEPIAAIYELARRHPSVGLRMTQPWKIKNPAPAILYLGDIGLKSWLKLTPYQKDGWQSFAGNMKGLDFRNEFEKCESITEDAFYELTTQRGIVALANKAKTKGITHENFASLIAKFCHRHPFSADEMNQAVSSHAIDAHRRG
jgi:hypothetical protein